MALPKSWKKRFIDTLRQTANVLLACRTATVSRSWVYEKRAKDAKFAAAWDEAIEEAVDALEAVARSRAVNGVERRKPVYYKVKTEEEKEGVRKVKEEVKMVGEIVQQEYSDTLLIFLLKAHRPEKYRDRLSVRVEHKDLGDMTVEELKEYGDQLRRRAGIS